MRELRCRTCKRHKPEDTFAPRPDTKRGRRSECKPCAAKLFRRYYVANRKRVIARVSRKGVSHVVRRRSSTPDHPR